jgi:leader peptidase (prepilin peptidase) / N-methyltransferase
MEIYLIVIVGILGAAIGSFINVCVDRIPAEKSLLAPPSHCDGCQRRLRAWELVPVFSYIFLRGRCQKCGAKIPIQVLLVELGCGLWTAFLMWDKGLTSDFAIAAFFSWVFILIGLLDFKTKLVYGVIVFPAIAIALILAAFVMPHGIINALEGAGLGAAIILIPFLVTRGGGMGFGDVEIALLMGVIAGFYDVVVPILLGIVLGGIAAIILLAFKIRGRKDAIPFGPFLSVGAIVSMVWGAQILHWWLGLFTR